MSFYFCCSVNNYPTLSPVFVKVTIPTGRPSTAPGMSRICASCLKCMGTPLNSQNYSRWSTGKCRWGVLGTVLTGMPLGRSKYLALLQCSPRSSTSDQQSNSFRPESWNEPGGKQDLLWEILKRCLFFLVLYCMLIINTIIHICI